MSCWAGLPLVARGQVGGTLGDAVTTTQAAAAAGAAAAGADDAAAIDVATAAGTNESLHLALALSSWAAANARGGADAAVASIENANDRLSWSHAAIGVLRGTLDAIVFSCGEEIGLGRGSGS